MTSSEPAVPLSTPDTAAVLQRVLAAVEADPRRGRLELAIAIILSLATLSSTWCGYRAQRWAGVASSAQATADTAERQAAEDTIVGLQLRTFDGIALINYWAARRAGDTQSQDLLLAHVRPQLRAAIEAAIADGILTTPGRVGPLQRPEYVLVEEQEAARLRKQASDLNTAAATAGGHSGAYVMLTLMFASVLFFGGITGTFRSRRVRVGLATIALAVFVVTVIILVDLSIRAG